MKIIYKGNTKALMEANNIPLPTNIAYCRYCGRELVLLLNVQVKYDEITGKPTIMFRAKFYCKKHTNNYLKLFRYVDSKDWQYW